MSRESRSEPRTSSAPAPSAASLRRLAGEEHEPDKDEPDQHECGQAITRELEAAVENREGAKGVPAQIQAGRGGARRKAAPLVDLSRLASAILGRVCAPEGLQRQARHALHEDGEGA